MTSKARQLADLGGDTANLEDISSVLSSGPLSNRNLIINGAMQVWQRATSNASASANTYPAADRWKFWVGGAVTGTTRTAFTVGQTDVPSIEYYNSISIGANSSASTYVTINQHIENVTLANSQTLTLSFYAKASQSWTIALEPVQNFGSGGSARVLGSPQNVTVGTSWARHTITFTTASISGKTLGEGHNFELAIWLSAGSDFNGRTGSIGNQSGTFDITGVQLEVGDTATPFEHRSYGQELALCQRYYQRYMGDENVRAALSGNGGNTSFPTMFLVQTLRAAPSVSVSSAGDFYSEGLNGGKVTVASLSGNAAFKNTVTFYVGVSSGITGSGTNLLFKNATGYLEMDAEL